MGIRLKLFALTLLSCLVTLDASAGIIVNLQGDPKDFHPTINQAEDGPFIFGKLALTNSDTGGTNVPAFELKPGDLLLATLSLSAPLTLPKGERYALIDMGFRTRPVESTPDGFEIDADVQTTFYLKGKQVVPFGGCDEVHSFGSLDSVRFGALCLFPVELPAFTFDTFVLDARVYDITPGRSLSFPEGAANLFFQTGTTPAVPEPSMPSLMGVGLIGLAGAMWRRRSRQSDN